MHPVFLYRSVNVVMASLSLWRMDKERQGLVQKWYAQKPKSPV